MGRRHAYRGRASGALGSEHPPVEFETAVNDAFRKLAREVRIPGFRPGKAPRRILEARFGADVAREQALKDGIPGYYADAVVAEEIDAIAPPEIDITAGEEDGDVEFDAVVEVRPVVNLTGYDSLTVELEFDAAGRRGRGRADRGPAGALRRSRGVAPSRSSTATTRRWTSADRSTASPSTT